MKLNRWKVCAGFSGKENAESLVIFTGLGIWGRHFWARGYFAVTSGNVTDEVIAEYIKNQDVETQDDEDFKITG